MIQRRAQMISDLDGTAQATSVLDLGRSVGDRVAAYLESAILDGRIEPGMWLREIDLAKQLGISRTPLRESFLILVSKGLLEIVPRRGARVRIVSDKDYADIISVRIALDGRAAKLAAEKRSASLVRELNEIVEAQRQALRKVERSTFHDLGQALDAVIYKAAENPKLLAVYQGLAVEGALNRLSNLALPGEMDARLAEHERIVLAIEKGDPEAARIAAETHMTRTLKSVLAKTQEAAWSRGFG